MMTRQQGFIGVAVAAVLVCWAGTALAASPALRQCQADLSACNADLQASNANLATCTAELSQCRAAGGQAFPATGQTTCYDSGGTVIPCAGTGQDGDVQAGATLRYTDNGDGTITDRNTLLMWEKKSDDGSIHDKDNGFTWDGAFAHIAALNQMSFAGHTDWRLPNVRELQSIVDYGQSNSPSVSFEFNNNCFPGNSVLSGSCTSGASHWSSTTLSASSTGAWIVAFFVGDVGRLGKSSTNIAVRAVRGGSNLGP